MMKNVIGLILIVTLSSLAFGFAGGDGSEGDPYQIATLTDLIAVNSDTTASYIMVNDIDLNNVVYSDSLISSGYYEGSTLNTDSFSGTFDGDGHVIRNLLITNTDANYVVGLFGVIGSGVVKNLGIIGADIDGGHATGALAGRLYGTVSNCYVTNDPNLVSGSFAGGSVTCSTGNGAGGLFGTSGGGSIIKDSWAEIDVTAYEQAGGLVGQIRSNVRNCYATGNVEATHAAVNNYAGGFAGRQEQGVITNCYATGDVASNGNSYGGFVGFQNKSFISHCYSTGNVTGTYNDSKYGGGFAGWSDGASAVIRNCYSTGDVDANTPNSQRIGGFAGQVINLFDSYATGSVTAHYGTGGLVGLIGLGTGSADAQVVRCYATGQVNGEVTPVAGLVAYNYGYNGDIVDCFFDTETSGTTVGVNYGDNGGWTGKTTAEMMTESTFTDAGWEFDNVWMKLGKTTVEYPGYPVLSYQVDLNVADLDKDSAVNFDDLSVMASEWLSAETY